MKNKIYLLIFSYWITLNHLFPQKNTVDSALLFVQYQFKHKFDTTDMDNPYYCNYVLSIGNKMTIYRNERFQNIINESVRQFYLDLKEESIDNETPIYASYYERIDRYGTLGYNKVVQYFGQPYYRLMDAIGISGYFITIKNFNFKWKLHKESEDIGGYKCFRATCRYAGRNYTAYYCPQLPFNTGPWKFNGLPGLPLYIYDDAHEVEWEMLRIYTDPQNSSLTDNIEDSLIPINEVDYKKLKIQYEKDPKTYMLDRYPEYPLLGKNMYFLFYEGEKNINFKHLSKSDQEKYSHPYYLINNPIELTDKK
jgi:GLPGLI family protein